MADGCSWRPPRPCEAYGAEWRLCRSARHLLHHLYAFGELPACEQWRRDLARCREWEQRRSAEAQQSLCESERARVQAAQKHTPVWALRQSPLQIGTAHCHRTRTSDSALALACPASAQLAEAGLQWVCARSHVA